MSDATPERWLSVVGYEGLYEVSDLGRVKSFHGRGPRILRPGSDPAGRRMVSLRGRPGEKASGTRVYLLILEAFIGPRPEGAVACHNNGDPSDDRLINLRWDSWAENHRDTVRHGRNVHSNTTHCPRGHLLAPPNLQRAQWRKGRRACLACHRATSNYRSALDRGLSADMQSLSDHHYRKLMEENSHAQ